MTFEEWLNEKRNYINAKSDIYAKIGLEFYKLGILNNPNYSYVPDYKNNDTKIKKHIFYDYLHQTKL